MFFEGVLLWSDERYLRQLKYGVLIARWEGEFIV